MRISGNQLRKGHLISHAGQLWAIIEADHVQPGKGGAYMSVILRNIKTNTKKNERFRAAEDVTRVQLGEEEYEFLYDDADGIYYFIHPLSHEQLAVGPELFNVSPLYLEPGMKVKISFYDDAPLFVTLPTQVILTIKESESVVTGQTATSSYKPAILSNGLSIMVPPHIEEGMKIVVNTENNTYVQRYNP